MGYVASTPHPVDLVINRGDATYLVEAKVLYKGDATSAVRGAIGQLLDYRYHLYSDVEPTHLVGLFSESIGDGFVEFLESLQIGSVWWTHHGWESSPLAAMWGFGSTNNLAAPV